jgi:cobalt-zinc-cadmium efflux system outer membrane protein
MAWLRFSTLACALLAAAAALAQDAAPLSFAEAARRTLASHPEFQRYALALRAVQTRTSAAALRPPLEITAEAENIGASSSGADDATELTISLTSLIERGGKRGARVAAAEREAELVSLEQRIAMLDLLAETGRRFVTVAATQETLIRAQNRATQVRATLERITPRVAAARSPPTEKLSAEIDLAGAELAVANAARQLESARFALASLWAKPAENPSVNADLYVLPEPRTFDALVQDLDQLPDLARFAAEARLREAQLRLARAQMSGDWRVSAGVRRLEEFNDEALVVGFSMPFGSGRRGSSTLREAELASEQVPLSAQAKRLDLLPLLQKQWQRLRTARDSVRVIAQEQLPRAREVLELTVRGYEIGRFGYRELAIVQEQLAALEAQRLDAAVEYHSTRIEIERLTGAHLSFIEGQTP